MAEKISQPLWTIFTNSKDVKFQEYDIFPKKETPQGGGRTNTTSVAPRSHSPVAKLESQVIDTENKPSQLDRNKGISPSPRAGGGPSVVKSEDRTIPRATGCFKVREESVNPGIREKVQPSGSERKDHTGGQVKRSKDVGEKMQLPREFQPSTSTSIFEEPEEAAAAALNYFEKRRLESGRKFNFPISDYQSTLKKYYPHFINNAEHGIVGHVPGVEVGLTLRYRDELRLLGIHREKQKGIDSKDVLSKDGYNHERVALSVVLSGEYEDCDDRGEVLIYVGEGGRDKKSNQQVKDQTKKRLGNEALKNNCHHKIPVRVIRKRMDANSPSKRLYSYDGLYMVNDWEYIKGVAGFKVYRFMLVREPNQNALVWQKREPKPFVGHAARQDATVPGETKPFVGQAARVARRRAIACGETKPSAGRAARRAARRDAIAGGEKELVIGEAARRKATAGGEKEPVVGEVARRKATAGGETVVKEILMKGEQVSTTTSKEDELNFIDLSDEESVSSESEESEQSSFVELSDDESMSSKASEENSTGGSEGISYDFPSEESEEKPLSLPHEEEDDFIIVDGEEGGDCIVHEESDQRMLKGQKVSPGSGEEGEQSSMLKGELPLDVENVIVNICDERDERKDIGASEPENWKQNVEDERLTAHGKGKQMDDVVEGKAQDDVAVQAPDNEEQEALNDAKQKDLKSNASPSCDQENEKAKGGFEEDRLVDAPIDDSNDTSSSEGEAIEDGEYEVEKIVDKSIIGKTRRVHYRVRWKGFEEKDDTWEPLNHLNHCRSLVEKFNSTRKKRRIM